MNWVVPLLVQCLVKDGFMEMVFGQLNEEKKAFRYVKQNMFAKSARNNAAPSLLYTNRMNGLFVALLRFFPFIRV